MEHFFRILILSACIFSGTVTGTAQVTIGSISEPAQGALLDLKDQNPDGDNVTSKTGGLLLPRVELNALDDFSLPLSMNTDEKKKNHTGLLVYNVKTGGGLEKGIHQWNGTEWEKLNKITKTEGVTVKKMMYQKAGGSPDSILSLGLFEFRIYTENNQSHPQFRITEGYRDDTIHWQVNEYWFNNGSGYDFNLFSVSSATAYKWTYCRNGMDSSERNEVWIADLKNKHLYQVQFIILQGANVLTYIIIAKKY
ncbi:MAG: hypothetical protein LBC48_03235 [Dysgonamonadaceae bacterium]|jgi:hypothetical protein|nr:hypothetical protein [Dysgonamonadaceae bacterium]